MLRSLQKLVDTIIPPKCPLCTSLLEKLHSICPTCWQQLTFINTPECNKCGLPLNTPPTTNTSLCISCLQSPPPFFQAFSVLQYNEAAKHIITHYKFYDQIYLTPLLTKWLQQKIQPHLSHIDYIIPVPLHSIRLWQRGYNQSALLAQSLSRCTNIPYQPFLLKKIKYTTPQSHLKLTQRKKNVKHSFICTPKTMSILSNASILLLDDVYTTGSTLHACCQALQKMQVERIYVLTLARVV